LLYGLVARFSRRSRFAAGICPDLARMIAAMRSLNSSTVSTGRVHDLPMKMRVGSNHIKSEYRVVSDAIEALYPMS
jgi:hypothetical protein